jgi:hypothetical protein
MDAIKAAYEGDLVTDILKVRALSIFGKPADAEAGNAEAVNDAQKSPESEKAKENMTNEERIALMSKQSQATFRSLGTLLYRRLHLLDVCDRHGVCSG